jgi:hypothetical protein
MSMPTGNLLGRPGVLKLKKHAPYTCHRNRPFRVTRSIVTHWHEWDSGTMTNDSNSARIWPVNSSVNSWCMSTCISRGTSKLWWWTRIIITLLLLQLWLVCCFWHHWSFYSSWTSLCLVWYHFCSFVLHKILPAKPYLLCQCWKQQVFFFSTSVWCSSMICSRTSLHLIHHSSHYCHI